MDTGYNSWLKFNCSTGATPTGSNVGSDVASFYIQNLQNNWFRVFITVNIISATSYPYVLYNLDASSSVNLFYGVQVEANTIATSYIPTTTGQVTRAADTLSIPLSSIPGFNPYSGTLMFGGWAPVSANGQLITIDDGTIANQIMLYVSGTTLYLNFIKSSSQVLTLNAGSITNDKYFVMAATWINGYQAVSVNGNAVSAGSYATIPSGLTTLRIGSSYSANWMNTAISRAALYSRNFTNAELQAISS
jgi:hypothetical protein